jgi:hypothetical protein
MAGRLLIERPAEFLARYWLSMKAFAVEVTTSAIARLAERRAAKSLPPLEPADAVWVCHGLISLLAPVSLPDATIEQLAGWFCEWLPEIEGKLPAR